MLLTYLEKIHEPNSIEGAWNVVIEYMSSFGFDRMLYGFTRFGTATSFGDMDDILILSNHPKSYLEPYIDQGMYFNVPMHKWAAKHTGACSWSQYTSPDCQLTPAEQETIDFNSRHGVTAGVTISFQNISSKVKGAIALVAKPGMSQTDVDSLMHLKGREIVQMCNVAHLKLTSLTYTTTRGRLTTRQYETLKWVGEGKSTRDIATIMGLQPATVEKHLRLARAALNVDTTAQAVLKLSFQNQFYSLEN
ncbi:MAG: LuxR family transcriptional regulator [Marinosulfonomonas sp.]|nr:LuxR family transcriptional regulator [Marinosulfonomonas sp.]